MPAAAQLPTLKDREVQRRAGVVYPPRLHDGVLELIPIAVRLVVSRESMRLAVTPKRFQEIRTTRNKKDPAQLLAPRGRGPLWLDLVCCWTVAGSASWYGPLASCGTSSHRATTNPGPRLSRPSATRPMQPFEPLGLPDRARGCLQADTGSPEAPPPGSPPVARPAR
jgi:hypothetical protein